MGAVGAMLRSYAAPFAAPLALPFAAPVVLGKSLPPAPFSRKSLAAPARSRQGHCSPPPLCGSISRRPARAPALPAKRRVAHPL